MSLAKGSSTGRAGSDQRLMITLVAVMLVLIIGVSVLAPKQSVDDPTPSSTNNGPLGVKAAYLILERLGHKASRWNKSVADLNDRLSDEQAARTTLVLIEPVYDATQEKELKAQVGRFLNRGGQILTTGDAGARLLGGTVVQSLLDEGICKTKPEGTSPLAKAGEVEMVNHGGWNMEDAAFHGDNLKAVQWCGKSAEVVQFTVPGTAGKGSAVWWSSGSPMSTAELKQDPPLKLMLASVGAGRDVVFDDALHKVSRTLWDAAKGLPVGWVSAQAVAVFLLLVFSFSRRRGPIRMPVDVPRSSPVEFAASMGDLYEKGAATSVVTEAAKRRLFLLLTVELGLAQETVKAGPEAISEAIQKRLGATSKETAERLAKHLQEANDAKHGKISQKSVLKLVQAMNEDGESILAMLSPAKLRGEVAGAGDSSELETVGAKETR